jgi:hypothetical protein
MEITEESGGGGVMLRLKLSLAILLFGVQFVLPTGCIAGTTQSAAQSYLYQNSTMAGLSSQSQSSVANGNQADTHQQSMASFMAGSENGATFFNVTVPNYIPPNPSGLLPDWVTGVSTSGTQPSNYVTSAPMASNYIITGSVSSTVPSTAASGSSPKVKVWAAKAKYRAIKRSNEMLASKKQAPKEVVRQSAVVVEKPAVEQIAAPVEHYYQLSSSNWPEAPIWAGFGAWPAPNAYNHN